MWNLTTFYRSKAYIILLAFFFIEKEHKSMGNNQTHDFERQLYQWYLYIITVTTEVT